MISLSLIALLMVTLATLAYMRAPMLVWIVVLLVGWGAFGVLANWSGAVVFFLMLTTLVAGALLVFAPLRLMLLSAPLFSFYKKMLPTMSDTERVALEAGTVWWEGQLFSGRPDWKTLFDYPWAALSEEEQSFLDNETNTLCAMIDDWACAHTHNDLSPQAWAYVKDNGFLGMIIPKEYGGKGFSAHAHSQVVLKLSTRSSTGAVSVMVPNSLGPAELLLHYGTADQKNYYLPRLAKGLEIPAFSLTSPQAGSDAASIPDRAIICKGLYQGKEIIGMRVTWDKRYTTLGPICTVLGLAFRLYDPDKLIGDKEDIGITCALVPATHQGVKIGRRHAPLNANFQNGPNSGKDVFMPLDFIVGGVAMAGQGWRMLMECLAAGRSISLPATAVGMMKLTARSVGAYARVRTQFKTPIGRFEGVQEPLARIGGHLYLCDAARRMTVSAVDLGEKPSVVSAMVKYHLTERSRQVVNDGMDVLAGKGICLGPQNFLGRTYQQLPVGITVEGANILTRSLIIFGQGAIRCHPYVLKEMAAAREQDAASALAAFDEAIFEHLRFISANKVSAFFHALTGSRLAKTPLDLSPCVARYCQHLTRMSAAFAYTADLAMLSMGADLKRKEKISARLGDIFSLLYLCSATLKRFESEGCQREHAPFMHWAMQDALFEMQEAFFGIIANFPNRFLAFAVRAVVFPFGRSFSPPKDALGQVIAQSLITPSAERSKLVEGSYVPESEQEPVKILEEALLSVVQAEPIEALLREAQKKGKIKAPEEQLLALAVEKGILSTEQQKIVLRSQALRQLAIRVDDFPADFVSSAR